MSMLENLPPWDGVPRLKNLPLWDGINRINALLDCAEPLPPQPTPPCDLSVEIHADFSGKKVPIDWSPFDGRKVVAHPDETVA